EITDVHTAVAIDEQITGRDVSVNQALLLDRRQTEASLLEQMQRCARGEPGAAPIEVRVERAGIYAVDPLQQQVPFSAAQSSQHVRRIDGRQELMLALQSALQLGRRLGQELLQHQQSLFAGAARQPDL